MLSPELEKSEPEEELYMEDIRDEIRNRSISFNVGSTTRSRRDVRTRLARRSSHPFDSPRCTSPSGVGSRYYLRATGHGQSHRRIAWRRRRNIERTADCSSTHTRRTAYHISRIVGR